MTSRADKLLEGFKLGSLGASPRFVKGKEADAQSVEPTEKTVGHVTVLKDGFTDEAKQSPFIFWQEDDGMKYSLVLSGPDSANRSLLWFYGGDTLEYAPDGIYGNGIYFFRDYSFLKFATTSFPLDTALQQFNKYRSLIKAKGVAGFVADLPTFRKAKTDMRYNTWLRYMRKELGIKK